ncbi:MAG: aldehyde ferredoxin oxidoreductase C-terminal domain-containing protein [bacterium]
MWTDAKNGKNNPTDYKYRSAAVDLSAGTISLEEKSCADLEDFLGGIGRIFKVLSRHDVSDPYAPSAPLVMELGCFSGTNFMTGLRTFFGGYSPLKSTRKGAPSAMWSAGSGKFGSKVAFAGLDEILFTGRSEKPVTLVIKSENLGGPPSMELVDASSLLGKDTHEKIMALAGEYEDAHFAVIGPPGENFRTNRMAAIALSSVNQLKSGDCKPRFCGRGGFGGVMGSKNLIAIVAQAPDDKSAVTEVVKEANKVISRGAGSKAYRDAHKAEGGGGTWRNIAGLHPIGCLPERNFEPPGDEDTVPLYRGSYEEPYVVKDESCFKCGIACHKNIYDRPEGETAEGRKAKKGRFRVKFDYEPLDLLAPNCGIYDKEEALEIVELADRMGFDAISLGATVSYAMEYNERNPDKAILGGLRFGEYEKMTAIIRETAAGRCEDLGQGVIRLSMATGETSYAMQGKGLEYPAYLPETNPGYPWALAGGHMSLRTFLLLILDGQKTDMDYWEKAVMNGIYYTRDDLIGTCKFAGVPNENVVASLNDMFGLSLTNDEMQTAIRRAYLRGRLLEKKVGYTLEEYDVPERVYERVNENIKMPAFITREFMAELKQRVEKNWDELTEKEGISLPA